MFNQKYSTKKYELGKSYPQLPLVVIPTIFHPIRTSNKFLTNDKIK